MIFNTKKSVLALLLCVVCTLSTWEAGPVGAAGNTAVTVYADETGGMDSAWWESVVSEASDWKLDWDAAFRSGGNAGVMLTDTEYWSYGSFQKKTPVDTRNDFSISFDYWMSQTSERYGGMMLVFAEKPISISYSMGYLGMDSLYADNKYYGIGLNVEREELSAVCDLSSSGSVKYLGRQDVEDFNDGKWHKLEVRYDVSESVVTVYRDGSQILLAENFEPEEMSYIGFSAVSGLSSERRQIVRNVNLQKLEDASRITLNANGGSVTGSPLYVLRYSYGVFPTPVRSGYDFAGWYTAKQGGTRLSGTNYGFAKTQTLYAHWNAKKYSVIFQPNGGKVNTKSKTVTYDSAYGSLPTATRKGYRFAGWYTAASGGNRVTSATKYAKTSGQTVYAHWSAQKYKVTFHPNKGTVKKKSKTVAYDGTYGSLPMPKRKNYLFQGWYTKKSGGKLITADTQMTTSKKHTLYAHWAKVVKVKFNPNGGKTGTKTLSVAYKKAIGTLPVATRSNYIFQGWYTKKKGGKKISESTVVKKAATYYAHWKKKSSADSGGSKGSSTGGSTHITPIVPSSSKTECFYCKGHGSITCPTCKGKGKVLGSITSVPTYGMGGTSTIENYITCRRCRGNKVIKCYYCGGDGYR